MEANGGAQAGVDLYIIELAMRSLEQQINWLRSDSSRAHVTYNLLMCGGNFLILGAGYALFRGAMDFGGRSPWWVFYFLSGLLVIILGSRWLWKKVRPQAMQSLRPVDQELEEKRAEYRLHWERLSVLAAIKPAASQPVGPAGEAPPSAEG